MLSPEQSDIRKSLDSIQSMLSSSQHQNQHNHQSSPMTATSLSSRIHRASFENNTNLERGSSNSLHSNHQLGGGGGGLNDNNNYTSPMCSHY